MPQSSASLTSDKPEATVIDLPRPAINLALRVLQLMSAAQYVELRVIKINGAWHLLSPGGVWERLG